MKTICYNFLLALLLVPFLGTAGNDTEGRYTKEKKISKKYEVSANAMLRVSNKYGNVDVTTWDQNRVEIDVLIRANGNNEEDVRKRLDEIDVIFRNSRSEVRAETLLETSNSPWWTKIFGFDNNVNVEINYRIKAPVTNHVNLDNDYGNISIDKLEGNATISCDYGRLFIGELLGEENSLNFDYTRNSHIQFIKKGQINADYSEYTIEEAGALQISADYTKSHIEKVENLTFNCDYGNIVLNKVRNVRGQGDYLGTRIGQVYNSVELELDYGSATIEKIMGSAKSVDINSDYTSLKIGYDPKNPFSFRINTSYAGVKGLDGNDFEISKRQQSNTKNYYEGHYLNNSGSIITINTSYGSVNFVN